ncbi:MAG: DoxX family protein [Flavobacteriales bacterium]
MESTTVLHGDTARQKNHNMLLWGMQGFLFLAFGAVGIMQLTMPIDRLTAMLSWPGAVPEFLVRAVGGAEVAGAMGVLLPALTRMQAWITSYAAMGLATVMICALGYHLMLFQGRMLIPTIVLGVIAGYVAWGRDKVVPFPPKG